MAHENATPRPWRKSITLANGRTIRSGSKIVAEIWPNGDSMEANADLVLDAVNAYDTLRAERDALREENERLKAGGWQPIETAPKDGTAIDVWAFRETTGRAMRYVGCAWGQRHFGTEPYGEPVWLGLQDRYSVITPTHWMPLPEEPQS